MSAVGDNSAIKCAIFPYESPTDPKCPWAWHKRMMANFRQAKGRDLIDQGLTVAMKTAPASRRVFYNEGMTR
ncbi:MAG: hypothetical protein FJ291_26670 [Planctomycetes bacterium]|nr:hypothetical protein [Planctomycetota bacterium]